MKIKYQHPVTVYRIRFEVVLKTLFGIENFLHQIYIPVIDFLSVTSHF